MPFTATPSGSDPQSVTFANSGLTGVTAAKIDKGDGTALVSVTVTAGAFSQAVTYGRIGQYTATLLVAGLPIARVAVDMPRLVPTPATREGVRYLTATIANGASLSPALTIPKGFTAFALYTPSAWTAAAISFQGSYDGTNFADMFDSAGVEVFIPSASIATAAARRFALDPQLFLTMAAIKIRSGLTGAAVNQGAARSLILCVRRI